MIRSLLHLTLLMISSLVISAPTAHYDVTITLPSFEHGDYRRPYMAVWVADRKNKPVSVLKVWRDEERWLKDLKHFWRRVLRKETIAVDGVTGATRGPGQYTVTWKGLDQQGKPIDPGHYKLCTEVAREHGGHNAKCITFEHPAQPGSKAFKLQGEFTQLTLNSRSSDVNDTNIETIKPHLP